jgi:serine/threonine protein kinase/WD40 repeat protein
MSAALKRVQAVFLAAVEVENPADRRALLECECAGDAELLARVEGLLRAHDAPGSLLDPPAPSPQIAPTQAASGPTGSFGSVASTPPIRPSGEVVGALIAGRYKLVERIGEGGMGTVWVAEQKAPIRRLVALKLVKPGMDSAAVLARFEAERQALALMDHPHIAKILDAGTAESGRPFFAMELVKGFPLNEYCDARRLPVRDRLTLFTQICSAVQHAHQKGIIHRDLKPTNILVTEHDGKPVPKVIDFGLAKALHSPHLLMERTLFTAFGAVVGTPLYMAPEQVGTNALDVDTRVDIYALGVILYELLTGTTPLERRRVKEAAWDEFKRLIREEEPPTPSTRLSSTDALPSIAAQRQMEPAKLGKLVRGDLDWIVMKSLEKDRNRRYDTADALSLDVLRFLHDEPVLAGPPSATYRLRKFVRRNRARVITAAVFVALLVAGVIGSTLFAIQASINETKAIQAQGNADTQAGIAEQKASEAAENARQAKTNEDRAKAEAERVRGMLYAANMGRAQDALRDHRVGRTRQLLNEMRPEDGQTDLRGFEWHYLWNQLHGARDVAEIHSAGAGTVNWYTDCPTLSTDGRWAASARMAPPDQRPPADGKPPAARDFIYHVRVWDTATGQIVFSRDHTQPNIRGQVIGHDVALCPSAGLVAWGSDRSVTVYDMAANAEKKTITLDYPLGHRQGHLEGPVVPVLFFDPTGTRLAALTLVEALGPSPRQTIRTIRIEIREVASGQRLLEIPPTDAWIAWGAGFSPDGTRLAVRSIRRILPTPGAADPQPFQSRIAVWDLGEDKPRFELPPSDDLLATNPFTPNGRWLALVRGRSVVLYNAATGEPWRVYAQGEQAISAFAFSRDGKALALGEQSGTITVFADKGGVLDVLYGHESEVKDLAFRPDGRLVSHARDGMVKEWTPARFRTAIPADQFSSLFGWDQTQRYYLTVRHSGWANPPDKPLRPEYTVWDTVGRSAALRRPLAIEGIDSSDAIGRGYLSLDGRRVVVGFSVGQSRRRWVDRYGAHVLIPPGPFEGLAGIARYAWAAAGDEPPVGRTEVVDIATGREILVLPFNLESAACSPKARFFLLHLSHQKLSPPFRRLEGLRLWDLNADSPHEVKLEFPSRAAEFDWNDSREWFASDDRFLTILAAVPRDTRAPYGPADHRLVRWELATGRLIFNCVIPDTTISRDDRFVLGPQGDSLARLIGVDGVRGMPDQRPPELELWKVNPDGETAKLWTTGAEWMEARDDLPKVYAQPYVQLEFSPDGGRLFVIGRRKRGFGTLQAVGRQSSSVASGGASPPWHFLLMIVGWSW